MPLGGKIDLGDKLWAGVNENRSVQWIERNGGRESEEKLLKLEGIYGGKVET